MSRFLFVFVALLVCFALADATAQTRTVVLQFTPNALTNIYAADEWIVLVREAEAGTRSVVWAVAYCFEDSYVSWNDTELSVYAFPGLVTEGHSVLAASYQDRVATGFSYPLEEDNVFGTARRSLSVEAGEIGILNNSTDKLVTAGLAQSVSTNEMLHRRAPLSVYDLLEMQHAVFHPSNRVSIFMAKTSVQGGLVVDTLEEVASSSITSFNFFPDEEKITFAYDEETASFIRQDG
jgi:hypothetical protein